MIKPLKYVYSDDYQNKEYKRLQGSRGRYDAKPTHNRIVLSAQPHFYEEENNLWQDPAVRKRLIKNRETYLEKKEFSNKELLRGFKISGIHKGFSHFSPLWIKAVIEEFGFTSIYDPCAGWGHRLLGALVGTSVECYWGNDLDSRTVRGLHTICKKFDLAERVVLTNKDSVELVPDRKFDAMFTCPPYFNTEIYMGMRWTKTAWLDFWRMTLKNSLKVTDTICFVINNKYADDLTAVAEELGLVQKKQIVVSENKSHFRQNSYSCEILFVYVKNNFTVKKIDYTHNIKEFVGLDVQVKYCWGLYSNDDLVGALLFGGYTKRDDDHIKLIKLHIEPEYNTRDARILLKKALAYFEQHTNYYGAVVYLDKGSNDCIFKVENFKFLGIVPSYYEYTKAGVSIPENAIRMNAKKEHITEKEYANKYGLVKVKHEDKLIFKYLFDRDVKERGIIYKVTLDNKYYIGQTVRALHQRKREHLRASRKGSHLSFHQALRQYGEAKWEVIEHPLVNILNDREQYWISKYATYGKGGYNMPSDIVVRIPIEKVMLIFDLRSTGMKYREIAHQTGYSVGYVDAIINGRARAGARELWQTENPHKTLPDTIRVPKDVVMQIYELYEQEVPITIIACTQGVTREFIHKLVTGEQRKDYLEEYEKRAGHPFAYRPHEFYSDEFLYQIFEQYERGRTLADIGRDLDMGRTYVAGVLRGTSCPHLLDKWLKEGHARPRVSREESADRYYTEERRETFSDKMRDIRRNESAEKKAKRIDKQKETYYESPTRQYSTTQIVQVLNRLEEGVSSGDIATMTGIPRQYVNKIHSKIIFKDVTTKWESYGHKLPPVKTHKAKVGVKSSCGKRWDTIKECAEEIGVSPAAVRKALAKGRPTNGYTLEYEDY